MRRPAPRRSPSRAGRVAVGSAVGRRLGAGASSEVSCDRIARSSRCSSTPGSIPSSALSGDAAVAVDLERFGLAAGPVERRHQLPAHVLAQRMLRDGARAARLRAGRSGRARDQRRIRIERDEPELLEPFRPPAARTARTRGRRARGRARGPAPRSNVTSADSGSSSWSVRHASAANVSNRCGVDRRPPGRARRIRAPG